MVQENYKSKTSGFAPWYNLNAVETSVRKKLFYDFTLKNFLVLLYSIGAAENDRVQNEN